MPLHALMFMLACVKASTDKQYGAIGIGFSLCHVHQRLVQQGEV